MVIGGGLTGSHAVRLCGGHGKTLVPGTRRNKRSLLFRNKLRLSLPERGGVL
jgi:hypothetical protein